MAFAGHCQFYYIRGAGACIRNTSVRGECYELFMEAVFMADGQGIPRERIRFLAAKDYSAYMEVSHMFLNQDAFDRRHGRLEVNPYYRFYDIFKELYQPEMREFLSLREKSDKSDFSRARRKTIFSPG